jgi:hypothetical protein
LAPAMLQVGPRVLRMVLWPALEQQALEVQE